MNGNDIIVDHEGPQACRIRGRWGRQALIVDTGWWTKINHLVDDFRPLEGATGGSAAFCEDRREQGVESRVMAMCERCLGHRGETVGSSGATGR